MAQARGGSEFLTDIGILRPWRPGFAVLFRVGGVATGEGPVIYGLEESMEMSGASWFLVALLRHLAGGGQTLRLIAPGVTTRVAESKQIRDTRAPGEHSVASAAARF